LRKAVIGAIPIRIHLEIGFLRSRLIGRLSSVPNHVRQNLETIFAGEYGRLEIDAIARRYIEFNQRRYLAKILPKLPGFDRPGRWSIKGCQYLDMALSRGAGAVLVTAHLGYPGLVATILRAYGYKARMVTAGGSRLIEAEKRREEWLSRGSWFRRYVYARTRVHVDRVGDHKILATLDVRPIFEALSRNEIIVITGDGMRSTGFAQLGLLGRRCPFPIGFMKIAMLTGSPVLPAYALEGERRMIEIEIEPPLAVDPKASVEQNLDGFARSLEAQLRRAPHLWSRLGVGNYFRRAQEWSEGDLRKRHEGGWR
jgi:lauroyl/myristoyl acyltransferase